jgi:zona occludens toxin
VGSENSDGAVAASPVATLAATAGALIMTIYAYVGRQGAGKSYGVVENSVLPACALGRPIITNIPVYVDRLAERYPDTDIQVVSWEWFNDDNNLENIPGGTLIIIDEVWRIFPSGQSAHKVSIQKKSFFAESRHRVGRNGLVQDIVLIVQDLSKIAAWVRVDIDKTFVATKLDAVGMDHKFRVDIYQGSVKGPKYPAPDLGFSVQEYKPEVYQFYQSHTKGTGAVGLEIKPDQRATVLSHPMVRFGIPLGILSMIFLAYQVIGFFTRHNDKKPAPAPVAVSKPSKPVKPAPAPSSAPGPAPASAPAPVPPPVAYSEEWRLTGISIIHGRRIVQVEGKGRVRRIDPLLCEGWDIEPECLVDGRRVSRFSGPVEQGKLAQLNPFGK